MTATLARACIFRPCSRKFRATGPPHPLLPLPFRRLAPVAPATATRRGKDRRPGGLGPRGGMTGARGGVNEAETLGDSPGLPVANIETSSQSCKTCIQHHFRSLENRQCDMEIWGAVSACSKSTRVTQENWGARAPNIWHGIRSPRQPSQVYPKTLRALCVLQSCCDLGRSPMAW